MQALEIAPLLDSLLAEHKPHDGKSVNPFCRVCLFNCAFHIQQEDKFAERCKATICDIDPAVIDAAIHDVNAALGEEKIVLRGGKVL